jgi:hypothetical protein
VDDAAMILQRERTLHGSLKVIHGWPVSKTISASDFQSSMAGSWRDQILPSAACASYCS